MKSSKSKLFLATAAAIETLEARQLLSATLLSQIPTQSLSASTGSGSPISLSTYFNDPSLTPGDTIVDIQTNLAGPTTDIPLMLTDSATPQTVANFLHYINSGEYAQTIIHRSITNFIIQGGGDHTDGSQITAFSSIPGESATATLKNTTGTIAMALTGTPQAPAPDSGTDEWFINLAANSGLDDASDGGPFTAFGSVIYNGMTTVNAIAALTTYNGTTISSEWSNIPLQNYAGSLSDSNFIITNPVIVPGGLNYSVVSSNPNMVTAAISNGALTLTPLGNGGTATITVTATDLGGGTAVSNFTVNVAAPATPAPTVAADSASTPSGAPVVVNVLANDTPSNDINASSVLVSTNPSDGTASVNSDGTITYTPTTGFTGNDSFSYTVASTEGVRSSPTIVSISVITGPVANADPATTTPDTATNINVLANDTAGAAINTASVVVATAPTPGTATGNSDGTITYTPTSNFVGQDTFTYTFADANGLVSAPATVTVNVAVSISGTSKTLPKSLTYTDTDGTIATITLKGPGTASFDFTGSDLSQTTTKTGVTITGTGQSIASITTIGTTAASILTITTKGGSKVVDIGALSTDSLKSLSAKGVIFTGDITATGSIGSLTISGADGGTISAVSLGSLIDSASFADNLNLTATGVSLTTFSAASVPSGTWTLAGSAKSISTTKGDLDVTITAASIGALKVKGNLSSAHIDLTATGSDLTTLAITGAFTNSSLTAIGNLGAISATSLADSEIFAGIASLDSSQSFPASSTDFASQSSIKSITLKTVKGADSFSDAGIAAASLGTLSLGTLQTDNGGSPTGIAAETITTLTATAGKKFTLHKLTSASDLSALLTKAGAVITPDFQIDLIAS